MPPAKTLQIKNALLCAQTPVRMHPQRRQSPNRNDQLAWHSDGRETCVDPGGALDRAANPWDTGRAEHDPVNRNGAVGGSIC